MCIVFMSKVRTGPDNITRNTLMQAEKVDLPCKALKKLHPALRELLAACLVALRMNELPNIMA